jgi:hypothetical protein
MDDSPPARRLAGRAGRGLFENAANLENLPRMGAAIEAYERDGPGFGLTQDGHAGSLPFGKEPLCLVLMLKADDGVVRIAHDNNVARGASLPPLVGP